MALHSHNKCSHSTHIRQFISKEIIMGFIMHEVMTFTDIKKLFTIIKFNIVNTSALMNIFSMINLYQSIL
ncbi:uncharacterized protein BDCG_16671 [Blastomyces dermatitidis ER-3]|uniref:Uncharacterized protein n=1 Tax=Ajellomyces dermatitidis (strain ER-3 / ATCC MYA-2586) TaxID=559297 RepID=A0ABX2VU15_AJEDR|nr:uncharacterized protein BDCG_16671 [Blastomyces dermatitidis ER-3]OAT00552.1 hypothetical protein BDCG_16671 [Blastomyces dermatitidis ER-3]